MKNEKKRSLDLQLGKYFCNNNCVFCVEKKRENQSFLSVKEIFKTLEKWRKKTDGVFFVGPDPTLFPHLCDVIKKAKELKYPKICLITNGRLLSYFNFAKNIVESGVTEIYVSFHGSCPSIQDAQTRMPGSFKQTFKACQNLSILKSIYKFKWNINFTFNKINADDFYKFFKMVIFFKRLDGLNIAMVMPKGQALRHFNAVVPKYAELAKIFQKTIEQFRENPFIKKRLRSKFELGITGLPFCVMKGYENYIGKYEDEYLNSPRSKKIRIFYRELKHDQMKGPDCKNCYYYKTCPGVWKEYIKRRGWKEFQPITI